jgi:hypothetical protein
MSLSFETIVNINNNRSNHKNKNYNEKSIIASKEMEMKMIIKMLIQNQS